MRLMINRYWKAKPGPVASGGRPSALSWPVAACLIGRVSFLLVLVSSVFYGSAGAVVLDEYTDDANFLAGKYTFYPIFNNPDDFTTIVDGTLAIGTGWKRTAGHMWNDGETLITAGDRVSIDIVSVTRGAAGLYLDGDLVDPVGGREIRYYKADHSFKGQWGSVLLNGELTGQMLLEIVLLSISDTQMNLSATLSGDGFTTVTLPFDLLASQAYFGPAAYFPNQTNRFDNLIYQPYVPGDTNGDGLVANGDLAIAISNFTGPQTDPPSFSKSVLQGDTNEDGAVDNGDLAAAISNFTGPTPVPVPEPTSITLLALAGVLMTRRRVTGPCGAPR